MSGELERMETWMVGRLKADATLGGLVHGIHMGTVPQDDELGDYPCVLVQYRSGQNRIGLGAHRLGVSAEYVVRGVAVEGEHANLCAIAARIDALLGRANEDGVRCYQAEPYRDEEEEEGIRYLHDGGVYTISVDSI